MDNLDKILEGLLFLSGDGLNRGIIMEKLQITPKQLDKAVEELKKRYNKDCGINLISYKDKLQLCGNPKYADDVSLVLNPIRERQLTKSTLEVMAIVAYKQPVTRLDVQEIRGLNSDYALQTLLSYKLIEVVGRKDAIGKPLLFGTTDEFLRHFGINSLDDLPDYDDLMKNVQQIENENNHLYNEFDIPLETDKDSSKVEPDNNQLNGTETLTNVNNQKADIEKDESNKASEDSDKKVEKQSANIINEKQKKDSENTDKEASSIEKKNTLVENRNSNNTNVSNKKKKVQKDQSDSVSKNELNNAPELKEENQSINVEKEESMIEKKADLENNPQEGRETEKKSRDILKPIEKVEVSKSEHECISGIDWSILDDNPDIEK